ncbi:MAG: heat-inducible transcriptional repressor HrcA [Candidatus Dormibacteraceae bacterium]
MEERKQAILKAVVQEFTETALPVGSRMLASRHFLTVSPATIRGELAELSEAGYLIQPHTSAGRVPSDSGYRYFVDFLMGAEAVPRRVRAYIEAELRNTPLDLQTLVERAAMTIATVTQNASVVSAPHGPQARIKHVDLVSLEPAAVLLILLLGGNLLRQQVTTISRETSQEDLSRLASAINGSLAGKDREHVRGQMEKLAPGTELEILIRIQEVLEQFERGSEALVVHDGVRNLLKQPEFSETARLQEVLEVLEESRQLSAVLREMVGDSDLQMAIGSENATDQLRGCTIVVTTYGPPGGIKGTMGVVGPTRMRYGQTVGRLRVVARAASDRMAELHA